MFRLVGPSQVRPVPDSNRSSLVGVYWKLTSRTPSSFKSQYIKSLASSRSTAQAVLVDGRVVEMLVGFAAKILAVGPVSCTPPAVYTATVPDDPNTSTRPSVL